MHKELKTHLLKGFSKDVRYDGRKKLQFRDITIEKGVSSSAEGSARVRIGNTHVMAGVKMELMTPYSDRPNEGNLMVNAEFLPMSSPEFETGPPGEHATEVARVVDRAIRESKSIDVKKLCIKPGEKVWTVSIDICTINDDGNLQDASCLAAVAALQDTRFPVLNEAGEIDYDKPLTKEKLPLTKSPIEVTVIKIGNHFIVDALPDEEKAVEGRLTVGVTDDGKCCAMQKGGRDPLSIDDLDKMIEISIKLAAELRKNL